MNKENECLYHKKNDSCRMADEGLKCKYYEDGLCPLHGNIDGKNVKTKYESDTEHFTFYQLMNGAKPEFS